MKRRYAVPVVMVLASVLAAPSAHAEQSATWDLPRDKDVVARFGFGSDIHVGRDSGKYGSAVDKLKNALSAYRQSGVDAVGFSGDLTDSGQVGQYQTLMDTLNTGTDDSEQVILAMGNHETLDAGVSDSPQRFKKYTGQDMNKLVEVNGVDVITMGPQNEDDDYRADYDFLKTTLHLSGELRSEPPDFRADPSRRAEYRLCDQRMVRRVRCRYRPRPGETHATVSSDHSGFRTLPRHVGRRALN
jgi:predicted MPP superfamily phosphohydrolase